MTRTITGRVHQKIEQALHRRGFKQPQIRRVMLLQFYLGGIAISSCFAVLGLSMWAVAFAAGVLLATWNFYHLVRFAGTVIGVPYSHGMLVALLARFYGRLLLTGLVLFVLIWWGKLSIAALLAGLTSVVVTIVFWGTANIAGFTIKEA